MTRQWKMILIFISFCVRLGSIAPAYAEDGNPNRVSDPVTFKNLAIYFVHGASRAGPVPLTLQEALAKKVVTVRETGQVNELNVENTGDEAVFIQSGDIVKGGQQDRVLSVSLLLPPHSGAMPIEMAGAVAPKPEGTTARLGSPQHEIWKSVSEVQGKLTRSLGAQVAAPSSRSSLQLSLENGQLADEQAAYVAALQGKGEEGDDIIGYVFAVNGKVNSADIYPSNGLFRKMWPKLLRAAATEAIGERDAKADPAPAPPVADVDRFMADAAKAKVVEKDTKEKTKIGVRESAGVVSLESRPATAPAAAWVHRNYIAK
jgi:hypothetical protein